ncbi:F0F1 ATP synthase subunit gamma, partial [Patescibacteria group bacterium]|nr:F0F1 ATP synthase subunit gamma [Patescibacteria group bacterium]
MATSTRTLRRRMKAIRSTGKIMKAMELVAAANMRKTVQKTIQSRTYAQQTEGLLGEVLERLVKPKNVCLTGHVRPDGHKKRTLV